METKTKPIVLNYLPYGSRMVDNQYQTILQNITQNGRKTVVQTHEGYMRKTFAERMHFRMNNGFPMITERSLSNEKRTPEETLRLAIAEIIGFIHGATTLEELKSFGLPKGWWKRWTKLERVINQKTGKPNFDLPALDGEQLGRFSYGGIWGKFPTQDGGIINQWENVIKQMIKRPTVLTHRVTNWYPPGIIVPDGKRQVVVAPCHGDVHIDLFPEKKELTLIHIQRAADMPTGVPYNMIHYPAIGMMLACVLGYTFKDYYHVLIDCHIYDNQEENVRIMLGRIPRIFPTVALEFEPTGDPVKDFFAIRPTDFHLSDYHAHPWMDVDTRD